MIKYLNRLLLEFNPVNKDLGTADKIINYVGGIFTITSLIVLYQSFTLIKYFFDQNLEGLDSSVILSLLWIFYLPSSLILFWKKKRLGWLMSFSFLLYNCLTFLILIITLFQTYDTSGAVLNIIRVSPFSFSFKFLFYFSLTILLSKKSVRLKFGINKISLVIMISLLIIISVIQYLSSYLQL